VSQFELYRPRRIVTANTEGGRSFVLSDGVTPHVLESGPGRGLVNLWAIGKNGPDFVVEDGAARPVRLEPPERGNVFRFFQLAPRSDAAPSKDAAESAAAAAFERMGAAHLRVDTTRNPSMHRSQTVDYIVLLKGKVKLVLDDEEAILNPFDVVIQRGTNHAWVNLEETPALLLGVLMDVNE
jgi:hypothetical protein